MPRPKETPPRQRAKRGSVGTKVLLRMDDALHDWAMRAATRENVSLTEWIRRAMRERVLRQEGDFKAPV